MSSYLPQYARGISGAVRWHGELVEQCNIAQFCVRDRPLMHLAFPGWFPLSGAHPAGDRFEYSVRLTAADGLTPVSTGRRTSLEPTSSAERWIHENEANSYLTVLTAGRYTVRRLAEIDYFGPTDAEPKSFRP